jgi:8-amino-7-oxononanoate synthase
VRLSRALRERGYWVPAIRPPSVPSGESLLRLSLTAAHTEEMTAGLLAALDDCRG